jgi:hypothetical protein
MSTKRAIIVVLGSGYAARFMRSLTDSYVNVLHTSRDPLRHLAGIPERQRLHFDLAEPRTWSHIPTGSDLLWCFPAAPVEAVRNFANAIGSIGRLVVLGSTSAYDIGASQEHPPPWIDETAPIDRTKPRVQGEEFLRHECGAIVLRVAGIYGPGRHPYDWIASGRVSLSDKYVNLIHVEDLAEICRAALQCGIPGAAYNVSDGAPRTWKEIGRRLYGDQPVEEPAGAQQSGKRLNTVRLRSMLLEARTSIRHPDLLHALDLLPRSGAAT